MSIEAINWVLNEAPGLPAHAFGVLLGLANHASPAGTGAYPSQDTLATYARKTGRAVRNDLALLVELKLIVVSPNQNPAAHISADVRPIVYDLRMDRKASAMPGSTLPAGSGVPAGSQVPGVKSDTDGQDRAAPGSEVPPGSVLPPGSTGSNARKPTSDKPSTNQTKKKTSSSSKAPAASTKRGTRIPDDFAVTEAMREWGRKHAPAVDGERETIKFVNYWQAKAGAGAVKVDWIATWRNWILNAADRYTADAGGAQGANTNSLRAQQAQFASAQPRPYGQPDPAAAPDCRWCDGGWYERTDGRMDRCTHTDTPPAGHPAAEPARSAS